MFRQSYFPVTRFSVPVHVLAQFSAVFTRNRRAATRSVGLGIPDHRFSVPVHVFAQFSFVFTRNGRAGRSRDTFCRTCFPDHRFSVPVHVFAQFSAVFTRNGRAGTRSV